MPGNVPAVTGGLPVMPASLFKAFTQSREFDVMSNVYVDGSSQRRVMISNGGDREEILPRMRWKFTKRLTPALMVELRDFYDEVGTAHPFYLYDPFGGTSIGYHDPTGQNEDGRFVGRFVTEWKQETGVGRGEVSLEIVELALAAGSDTMDFEDEDASGLLMVAGF